MPAGCGCTTHRAPYLTTPGTLLGSCGLGGRLVGPTRPSASRARVHSHSGAALPLRLFRCQRSCSPRVGRAGERVRAAACRKPPAAATRLPSARTPGCSTPLASAATATGGPPLAQSPSPCVPAGPAGWGVRVCGGGWAGWSTVFALDCCAGRESGGTKQSLSTTSGSSKSRSRVIQRRPLSQCSCDCVSGSMSTRRSRRAVEAPRRLAKASRRRGAVCILRTRERFQGQWRWRRRCLCRNCSQETRACIQMQIRKRSVQRRRQERQPSWQIPWQIPLVYRTCLQLSALGCDG